MIIDYHLHKPPKEDRACMGVPISQIRKLRLRMVRDLPSVHRTCDQDHTNTGK